MKPPLIPMLVLFPLLLSCSRPESVPVEKRIEAQLNQNLPIGTTLEAATHYLNGLKVTYGYDEKTNTIEGICRDVEKKGLVSTSVTFVVRFDEQKRVKAIEIKPVYTGP